MLQILNQIIMRKNLDSRSGLFNPRALIAVALCLLGASFGWLSFASSPSSGELTTTTPVLTYDAGPLVINQTPLSAVVIGIDDGPRCDAAAFQCDSYALTINLPVGYVAA